MNKPDLYTIVLYRLRYWVFIILILIIGTIKALIAPEVDPMDDSINKIREVFSVITVTDTTGNGFELTYATTNAVTKERLKEIGNRKHIDSSFHKLKTEAPRHFGNMLHTDIHDFASFALRYDPDPDIYLDHIFVYGYEKEKLYIGKNLKIKNAASWYDSYSKQGIQYILRKDFFYCQEEKIKLYRYYLCSGIYSTSYTDERYSHFSEDERL